MEIRNTRIIFLILFFLFLSRIVKAKTKEIYQGLASWYGGNEPLNEYTAYGEKFDPNALTCASFKHPKNTLLKVTCLKTGKSVVVRVNDKGPAKWTGRVIDLTKRAFSEIAPLEWGVIKVEVEVYG
jgi:rare lipoprotein A